MSATKPSFSKTEFLDPHPRLYHMAADGTWPSIQRYGLLSTSAVLDLASIKGEERVPLERQRRMEGIHVPLGGEPGGETFVLRDQKPLNESKLAASLVDMSVGEWLLALNRKVFFWPSRQRCVELLNARAYRDSWHTVMEVDSAALLDRHEVRVSPINSGAVLYDPPKRGRFTFTPIEDFPFERYRRRGRGKAVAEVAVDYAVPDVASLVTETWRARRDEWLSNH